MDTREHCVVKLINFSRHRFCVGDRFYLCENKILCQYDYEERLVFANMVQSPSSLAHIRRQVSNLQVNVAIQSQCPHFNWAWIEFIYMTLLCFSQREKVLLWTIVTIQTKTMQIHAIVTISREMILDQYCRVWMKNWHRHVSSRTNRCHRHSHRTRPTSISIKIKQRSIYVNVIADTAAAPIPKQLNVKHLHNNY